MNFWCCNATNRNLVSLCADSTMVIGWYHVFCAGQHQAVVLHIFWEMSNRISVAHMVTSAFLLANLGASLQLLAPGKSSSSTTPGSPLE